MSRELHVRWMMTGHGGWVERRLAVTLPSLYDVISVLTFIVLVWELWRLWKG